MSSDSSKFLRNKTINGWYLFWLISGPVSITMLLAALRGELHAGDARLLLQDATLEY